MTVAPDQVRHSCRFGRQEMVGGKGGGEDTTYNTARSTCEESFGEKVKQGYTHDETTSHVFDNPNLNHLKGLTYGCIFSSVGEDSSCP